MEEFEEEELSLYCLLFFLFAFYSLLISKIPLHEDLSFPQQIFENFENSWRNLWKQPLNLQRKFSWTNQWILLIEVQVSLPIFIALEEGFLALPPEEICRPLQRKITISAIEILHKLDFQRTLPLGYFLQRLSYGYAKLPCKFHDSKFLIQRIPLYQYIIPLMSFLAKPIFTSSAIQWNGLPSMQRVKLRFP